MFAEVAHAPRSAPLPARLPLPADRVGFIMMLTNLPQNLALPVRRLRPIQGQPHRLPTWVQMQTLTDSGLPGDCPP